MPPNAEPPACELRSPNDGPACWARAPNPVGCPKVLVLEPKVGPEDTLLPKGDVDPNAGEPPNDGVLPNAGAPPNVAPPPNEALPSETKYDFKHNGVQEAIILKTLNSDWVSL